MRENFTSGSVWGEPGNRLSYHDYNLILGINEIASFFSGLLFYKLPSRLKTG